MLRPRLNGRCDLSSFFQMKLTFIEAARGVEKEMTVSIMDACGSCKGNGSEPGTSAERFVHKST